MKDHNKEKGIIVEIYKGPDGSSDGIGNFSSRLNAVTLIGSNDFPMKDGVFEPDLNRPAVKVVKRTVCGSPYLSAYPLNDDGTPDTTRMFGGCFIFCSDRRLIRISPLPIPLHDRKEAR